MRVGGGKSILTCLQFKVLHGMAASFLIYMDCVC